jgi:hypothetical protein
MFLITSEVSINKFCENNNSFYKSKMTNTQPAKIILQN